MHRSVPRCFTVIVFDVFRKHLQRGPTGEQNDLIDCPLTIFLLIAYKFSRRICRALRWDSPRFLQSHTTPLLPWCAVCFPRLLPGLPAICRLRMRSILYLLRASMRLSTPSWPLSIFVVQTLWYTIFVREINLLSSFPRSVHSFLSDYDDARANDSGLHARSFVVK